MDIDSFRKGKEESYSLSTYYILGTVKTTMHKAPTSWLPAQLHHVSAVCCACKSLIGTETKPLSSDILESNKRLDNGLEGG